MSSQPLVVLTGPPGSGKSTVARIVSQLLDVEARDTDSDVEATAGKPISEIFIDDGEPLFRSLEARAVTQALRTHDGVLSLGGGAVMDPATQDALEEYKNRGGCVVFLDVSLAAAAPRIGFNQSRPLLLGNPRAQWKALMDQRRATYCNVANVHVLTDNQTPYEVAHTIVQRMKNGS
ncbi:shikimate kinase [Timonella sp. A28]|uniref:shikimate kinase n=1 Tax=Timonella sp. A28 TaxID=3442640 RepID=UPI003EBCAA7A